MHRKILVALVVVGLLAAVTGCAAAKPEDSVKACLDAMIQADFAKATAYVNGGSAEQLLQAPESEAEVGQAMIEALVGRITYTLGESKVAGEGATVLTKITAPDMVAITQTVMTEGMDEAIAMAMAGSASEDAIAEMFMEAYLVAIQAADAPMTTTDVTISLTKSDGKWLLNSDLELGNALTGGLLNAWAQLGGE